MNCINKVKEINNYRDESAQISAIITHYDVANLTSWDAKEILIAIAQIGLNINRRLSDIFRQCGIHFDSLLQLAELEQAEYKQPALRKKYRKSMLPNHFIRQQQVA